MFLRNFDNATLLLLGFGQTSVTGVTSTRSVISSTTFGDNAITVKQTNGTTKSYNASNYANSYIQSLLSLEVGDICLGDGNTPVTYDDYKLSGNLVKNSLTKISQTTVYDEVTKEYVTTLFATYTNTTGADITVSEWGLFAQGTGTNAPSSSSKGTYSNSGQYILLYREVLDTPVVIEAGNTTTFEFNLKVSLLHRPIE